MIARLAPELENAHVVIVGLGLMGGSLALALRSQVRYLTAVEPDAETRRSALERGQVDAATSELREGMDGADLVILAAPVSVILRTIGKAPLYWPRGAFLLDLGSTKRQICAAMDALPATFAAIGGHPMCGKETAGLQHAEASLYQDQTFVLCPTQRTTEAMWELAHAVVNAVGANALILSAEAHDRQVALVSHLPYLVAATLMKLASDASETQEDLWRLSASGFRDASRLSGSDPGMMKDIITSNRDAILSALQQYAGQLGAVISLLESGDDAALAHWLRERQAEHRAYRHSKDLPS